MMARNAKYTPGRVSEYKTKHTVGAFDSSTRKKNKEEKNENRKKAKNASNGQKINNLLITLRFACSRRTCS